MFKETTVKLIADLSSETEEAREQWKNRFEVLKEKEKTYRSRIPYQAKMICQKLR